MSAGYKLVQWNPFKVRYDLTLAACVGGYIGVFFAVGKVLHSIGDEILVLRALGTCAFVMLNFVLCIGPLCRLDRRLLPILYNRRHLGVATFFIALLHGLLALGYYHGFGVVSPPVSLFTSNIQYASIRGFPFEILGVIALAILFVMAATSHDFWLNTLSARVWKFIHMAVYAAWGLLVMHIALGAMQTETSGVYVVLAAVSVVLIPGLHLYAGLRETRLDSKGQEMPLDQGAWLDVAGVEEIPEGRAKVVCIKDKERIAIFRNKDSFSALTNVCAHQGGPVGEGRIVNGCVTCPWHGYQYQPEDGCSPPPFTEKIATYPIRVVAGRIQIDPVALAPGTKVEPAKMTGGTHA
jgi:nitrite reductase/ring-hydroxylating ferredoxin subunit/DMSO/TMAO reductase YedYZ heme-binding membrane subunit